MFNTTTRGIGVAVVALAAACLGFTGSADAGGGGCHARAYTEAAGSQVVIDDSGCFSPTVLHAAPGAEVVFRNDQEGAVHNVAGLTWGTWATGEDQDLTLGETFVNAFAQPGYYPYSCTLHYNMVGVVIVGEPGEESSRADLPVQDSDDEPAAVQAQDTNPSDDGGGVPTWTILAGAGVLALGLVGSSALFSIRRRHDR